MSRIWKRNAARVFDVCEFDAYEIVVKTLLASGFFPEDFALKATNFYFPKQSFAPAEVPPDAPICRALERAHELVTGEKPTVEGVPYGADMRLFIRIGDMPCVMYGAGDVNVAHAPDEHLSITELMTATKTVAWSPRRLVRVSRSAKRRLQASGYRKIS